MGHKDFLDWLENLWPRSLYLLVERLVEERPYQWVCLQKSSLTSYLLFLSTSYLATNVWNATGLINYSVPAGEAHLKALEVAREINQKV